MYLWKVNIRIEPHTLIRANERGATEDEIINTIKNGIEIIGKKGRAGKCKVFEFKTERNGKFYDEKKLEIFYVLEADVIITVTVYVYYGKF